MPHPHRVLEGTHRRMQDASEKYGKGKGGIFATVKNKLTSGHRRRCTDALWGCRAEIENASAELRVSGKMILLRFK